MCAHRSRRLGRGGVVCGKGRQMTADIPADKPAEFGEASARKCSCFVNGWTAARVGRRWSAVARVLVARFLMIVHVQVMARLQMIVSSHVMARFHVTARFQMIVYSQPMPRRPIIVRPACEEMT